MCGRSVKYEQLPGVSNAPSAKQTWMVLRSRAVGGAVGVGAGVAGSYKSL